ncbi:TPA: S41 family peptidase [Candidatus Poribacteria bacterium]|nr:S41 family peptidase [Candidatus Poribacteria bacterium]
MVQYNRKCTISIVALTAIAVVSVLLFNTIGKSALSGREERITTMTLINKLNEAIAKAETFYYKDVDRQKIYEGAIKGALAALGDPYSFYQSPESFQREREDLITAKFGGLGIRIYVDKGLVKILSVLPYTPAMKAGLQAGDYITKIGGEAINIGITSGKTLNDVVSILRGRIGTKVTISIHRRGSSDPFDVTLTRGEIKTDSVEKAMVNDEIAYIRITNFTGRTNEEFHQAMMDLFNSGNIKPKALILDLRNNPGGLLDSAYYVSDALISEGMIVSTRGRHPQSNKEYKSKSKTLCPDDVELVVLINEYSASGSEIVAGAIKDHIRGVLLGKKTFGKGVVQQRIPLKHGGAVSLTISTYYTPNGTSINEKGIEPQIDIDATKLEIADAEMRQKMRNGRYVNDFVEAWIEEEEKITGKTPQDFSKLEANLSPLFEILKQNNISLRADLVKLDAKRVFNNNVGIYQLIDLDHDNQLVKAIRIIETGEVQKLIASKIAGATADL